MSKKQRRIAECEDSVRRTNTAIKLRDRKIDVKKQPKHCTDDELVRWANQQRRAYFAGRLSAEKIAKLESIGGWVWENDYIKESMETHAKESGQEDAREDNNGRVPLTTHEELNMKLATVANEVKDPTIKQCIYSQKIVDLINRWTPKLPWIETARLTEDNRIAWFNGGYWNRESNRGPGRAKRGAQRAPNKGPPQRADASVDG